MKRNSREAIKANFERDIANHSMEVLRDDGLYRHLKFTNGGSSVYRFDIITWPGYLAVAGDMGEWVFSRIPDMFEFFIMDEHDFNHKHVINPGYWGEKLQAADCRNIGNNSRNGYEEFSSDVFEDNVKQEYDSWIEGNDIDPESDYATALWEALEQEVISAASDGSYPAYEAAMSFRFEDDDWRIGNDREDDLDYGTFSMDEFWDYNCTEYNYHYIWVLYAIVWGITQYNKEKQKEAA